MILLSLKRAWQRYGWYRDVYVARTFGITLNLLCSEPRKFVRLCFCRCFDGVLECGYIVFRSFGQHTFDRRRVDGTRSDVYVSKNVVNIVPLR